MAERETHSYLIQSIHLLNGSFGESNKMHKRKTHKLWGFKSINLHLYCWMYMSTGTCMNLNEYVALVHIVPPEPCQLVLPDMDCVKSCITSVHKSFQYCALLIFSLNAKHPLFHQSLRKFHSIYTILEEVNYFTLFSFDQHHRVVAMWCDIAPLK